MNLKNELLDIIEKKNINTLFQPIINFHDGEIIGYEALSRGPVNSPLHSPIKLLDEAKKYNILWKLELLFRTCAIKNSVNINKNKLIFLNVEPNIIKDPYFKRGFTKEMLSKYNINPSSIVFEITERTAIEDYDTFREVIDIYKEQGYKIAIDDGGSGYSGLRTISEIKPDFFKIDISLIENIDKDNLKQAILKSLVELSHNTDIKLIAEGIENEDDLKTLISLGVYSGQGYYIQKPCKAIKESIECVKKTINIYQNEYSSLFNIKDYENYIGQLSEPTLSVESSCSCCKVKDVFDNNSVEGLCIVNNSIPIGLITKSKLNFAMAKKYGYNLYSSRPISLVMEKKPLIADYYTPINKVSELAMNRHQDSTYDTIIVTKDSKYFGLVSIKKLLLFSTKIENDYARQLNPLTFLPGNILINKMLENATKLKNKYCVLYLDLDNFKRFNDVYGFENGDIVIKDSANMINSTIKEYFPTNSFVGHIGGDDFFSFISGEFEMCEKVCKYIINRFDNYIKEKKDIPSDGFKPTISIAAYWGRLDFFESAKEIGMFMGKIKKEAKKYNYSSYYFYNKNEKLLTQYLGLPTKLKII